jgi:hypothetical protein
MRALKRDWQVGDGREQAPAEYVLENAHPGDLDDAIRVVDDFCVTRSFMISVGDEKGEILDRATLRSWSASAVAAGCGAGGLPRLRRDSARPACRSSCGAPMAGRQLGDRPPLEQMCLHQIPRHPHRRTLPSVSPMS